MKNDIDIRIEKLLRAQEKTDEQMRKTDERQKKTDEEIKKVNKLVAGVTDGWGRMTESLALASIEEILYREGFKELKMFPRPKSLKDGLIMELDLLVAALKGKERVVIVVEDKTRLRVKDVRDLEENIRRLPDFFEDYADRGIIGALCYLSGEKEAQRYAQRRGFFLISFSGDVMELKNLKGFVPKIFRMPA